MKVMAEDNKQETQMTCSEVEKISLPNTKTITEWFARDQQERIMKLCAAKYEAYGKYSVYEVYNEHSKSL